MVFDKRTIRSLSLLGPSGAVGMASLDLGEREQNLVFLTADLCHFSGLDRFKKKYPQKLINTGIAEQNMIGIAAGLVKEGMLAYATTYASFATSRCLDQVRVNMAYMKLPIKLIGLTSGYAAGVLGATHMSIEDIAIMRSLPNMVVISPADGSEIVKAILAVVHIKSPVYIRLTGSMGMPAVYKDDYEFTIGKAIKLSDGDDVAIIATGSMVAVALKCSEMLGLKNISCMVINMHTIKPLDVDSILLACKCRLIVTLEEHNIIGGLYSAVAEAMLLNGRKTSVLPFGINDKFVSAGSYEYQLQQSGLFAENITEKIMDKVKDVLSYV